ncbi:MAG: hypothetical protein JO089_09480, partial [Alphaproteobacteria bacterium]|nr:hypothetical protein [Alphaproteobacteria bacterium]
MSVWVLHGVSLPEARAADMLLRLPLGEEEDFTDAVSMPELRQRLKARHPEAPPERINIMAEGMWRFTHGIGVEDILAMPQPEEEMVAFAQATGAVRYVAEEGGAGHYALPVRLFAARVPVEKFGRRAEVFTRRRHA